MGLLCELWDDPTPGAVDVHLRHDDLACDVACAGGLQRLWQTYQAPAPDQSQQLRLYHHSCFQCQASARVRCALLHVKMQYILYPLHGEEHGTRVPAWGAAAPACRCFCVAISIIFAKTFKNQLQRCIMSNDTPAPSPLPPMLQAGENKPKVLTTENIQELLDENAKIIKAIVDCQNAGKLDSCAKYVVMMPSMGGTNPMLSSGTRSSWHKISIT